MALSQVQCLDNNHVNLRTSESKPEFLYSEEQRLALEELLHTGQDAFEDYIKTNNIRSFLSQLELERILDSAEVYSPGSPENNAELYGESDGEELSLQYWPDRSDRSIPQLDIGWPDRASYRGVTRVQVHTQPPYEGQAHIKEVVRKMIGHAQKVIAVVMDLFTDIDIFRDLLDASYKRKVAVYIMLESTGVKHFMRMCEKAGMHTGHLKNLRVRSIRGAEFFSRSSKRVCGNQNQKFMFIDGDKAVTGSYSFTWTASRLDRNLITVLTGQVVDAFDTLFQDMYEMSNGVRLSKINLSSEPEPEYLPQAVPTPLPSATKALKLINPKYTLVSNCIFTSNGPVSDQTSAKNSTSKNQTDVIKQIKDTPAVPPVHPGLLNLEKVNMINYVPTWPDPEPPSDVIGFINIRDSNKPLQVHLMRSELFETSQAIRFKDSPNELLSPIADPKSISQTLSNHEAQKQPSGEVHFDQNQNETSSQAGDVILLSEKPDPVHVLGCNKADKEEPCVTAPTKQNKNIQTNANLSFAQGDASSDTKPTLTPLQPLKRLSQSSDEFHLKSSTLPNKSHLDSFATSDRLNQDQVIADVASQDHRVAKPETAETRNGYNSTQMSNCESSISSLSDEYFECLSPVADLRSVEDFFVSEKTPEYSIKNGHQKQEVIRSNSGSAENSTDLSDELNFFTPKVLKTSCSIVFNFVSAELKTASKITFAQESEKETINDDSKLPAKDSETNYFSQTLNGCFNFSSTSEQYFECSDTVGLKSETDCVVKKPGSVDNINLNDPLQIPKPVLEAELSCQNMEEKDESNMHPGQKQTEFQILELTEDFKAVLESENNTQTELDETVHRHQAQDSELTSEPEGGSQSMSDILQECKISASQQFFEKQTKASSVELAEKVQRQDLQIGKSLDFECAELEEQLLQIQQDLSLYSISEGKSVLLAEKNSKPELQDNQSKVSQNVVCERQSLKTAKLSLQDLQNDNSPDLLLQPSEVNAIPQPATDSESRSSILQDKADVTPVIPEMSQVELQKREELQNPVTSLDSLSNHQPNLEGEEHVNEELRLENGEVCPAVLERNFDQHNPQKNLPEQFENIELLIVEDSDLQEPRSIRPRSTLTGKLSKNEPVEPKSSNDRKCEENKLGHDVYSRNEKETYHTTAVVEKKQEGEHICTNQINKNLPEAKPKLAGKQPHQTSSRIPIQAKRGLTKLSISKPDPNNGLQSPKTAMQRRPLGKPLLQNKASITSPSPEKLSRGGISPVRSTQIPQRPIWTVSIPNSPISPHKPSPIQLVAPRIRQSDQPNVTRKRSASITKYNCPSSGISCPGQVKKQAFKGPSPNN